MRTATSHRPFNSVNDKYYRMEVELLRPGTIIPSASTVSRDLNLLYMELSKGVKSYFAVRIFTNLSLASVLIANYRNGTVPSTVLLMAGPHR